MPHKCVSLCIYVQQVQCTPGRDGQLPLMSLAHDMKGCRQSYGLLTFSEDGVGSGTAATALSMYVADLTLHVCNTSSESAQGFISLG